MSRSTLFPTRLGMRLAKTQISLHIRVIWSESLQDSLLVANDPKYLKADSEISE